MAEALTGESISPSLLPAFGANVALAIKYDALSNIRYAKV